MVLVHGTLILGYTFFLFFVYVQLNSICVITGLQPLGLGTITGSIVLFWGDRIHQITSLLLFFNISICGILF